MVENKQASTGFEADQMAMAAFEKFKQMLGMIESEEDIVQQCGGMRIRVYEHGEYPDKVNLGKMVKYPAGIELKAGGGLRLNCEASDLAMLCYHMTKNPDLRNVLRLRLEDEQKLMKILTI